jgi:hypothetical protein
MRLTALYLASSAIAAPLTASAPPLPALAVENKEVLEYLEKGFGDELSTQMKESLYSYLFTPQNGRYPNADRLCLSINGVRPRCMANPLVYREIRMEVFHAKPHAYDSLVAENKEVLEYLEKSVGPDGLSTKLKEALYSYLFTPQNGRYPNADRLCLSINGVRPRCMADPSVYDDIMTEVLMKFIQ